MLRFFRSTINKGKKKKKGRWGRWDGKTFLRLALHRTCMIKRLVRASNPAVKTPLLSILQCSESSKTSQSLLPITFWSRAPCRFLHLARERSSITERVVQAETPPPPVQPSLFQLPCTKLHKEQPHCGLETERLLHSKAFFAAHLKVRQKRWKT